MKTFRIIAASLLLSLIVPYAQPAFAQQTITDNTLCKRIDTASMNTQNSMNSRRTLIDSPKPGVSATEAKKYEQIRIRADELRKKHFEAIIAKLKSNQQKEAVRKYQSDLELAITKRRESISSAQKQFVDGVQELHSLYKTEVSNLESEFTDQITSAFDKAKSACTDRGSSQAIRLQLSNDIQLAKQSFGKNKLKLATNGQKYRQLLLTRNQAVSTAIGEFKQSEALAKQELVEAIQANQ